jgi:hypothetical protein
MAAYQYNHRQARFGQRAEKSLRQRFGFQSNRFKRRPGSAVTARSWPFYNLDARLVNWKQLAQV